MLDFYISLETEKNKLMDMFCTSSVGFTHEKRAQQYHFPIELAKKMYQQPRYLWDEELETFLLQTYLKNKKQMDDSLSFFQNYWYQNQKKYFDTLENFFQFKFPVYRVLLGHFLDAISNWQEPNIVLNAYSYQSKNPFYHVYALLYEMILSQVFIWVRKSFSKEQIPNKTLWAISELSAMSILQKLFVEFSENKYTGYPILDEYAPQFIQILERVDCFNEFMEEVLKLAVSKTFFKG